MADSHEKKSLRRGSLIPSQHIVDRYPEWGRNFRAAKAVDVRAGHSAPTRAGMEAAQDPDNTRGESPDPICSLLGTFSYRREIQPKSSLLLGHYI